MKWGLWVDYHRTDGRGITHAIAAHAEAGVFLEPGRYVVVGNEDADPAVAEVLSVDDDGVVLVRVL